MKLKRSHFEWPMKDINTSTFSFEKNIKGNILYVDKTDYVWNLAVCNN